MATASYPIPEEVRVTRSEAEGMMQDPSLVVVLATPDLGKPDTMLVTFWAKDRGVLPPWVRVQ